MAAKTPLTKEGAEKIQEELLQLKTKERRKISEQIAEARAHGDLKENAEYHAAKEQQGFMEAKIRKYEEILSNAQIIDTSTMSKDGKVVFGTTIVLLNVDTEQEVTYKIVGEEEASLKENKISYKSPIARAIIGKYQGDEVVVVTPNGEAVYEVTEVLYK